MELVQKEIENRQGRSVWEERSGDRNGCIGEVGNRISGRHRRNPKDKTILHIGGLKRNLQ